MSNINFGNYIVNPGSDIILPVIITDENGEVQDNYNGTVHFSTTDPIGLVPKDYTFTSNDLGTHYFSGFWLGTTGVQTISVTDNLKSSVIANTSVNVVGQPIVFADHFNLAGPTTTKVKTSISLLVTAMDKDNHQLYSYQEKIHFSSSDPLAQLPSGYQFNAADAGRHMFIPIVFNTSGVQTITVTDISRQNVKGSLSVKVSA